MDLWGWEGEGEEELWGDLFLSGTAHSTRFMEMQFPVRASQSSV